MKWIAALVVVAAFPATAEAHATRRWFHSPSGNITCELAPTHARCQTFQPARSVSINSHGVLHICRGTGCLANEPINATTLRYGHSIRVGPFRCLSKRRGMRCSTLGVYEPGERLVRVGFWIARNGVRVIRPPEHRNCDEYECGTPAPGSTAIRLSHDISPAGTAVQWSKVALDG